MDKYKHILFKSLTGNHYYTNEDLRINKKYGFMLNRQELSEYLSYKEDVRNDVKVELQLKSYNTKKIYYFLSEELIGSFKDYVMYFISDIETNNSTIISDNYDEVILSRLASELDGTLRIEGVNTTRRKIDEVIKTKKINDSNDQIVYNMNAGYEFIEKKPAFNKENLKKLYDILSCNSLEERNKIYGYYRTDMVEIDGYDGCPVEKIEECMNSLFVFVNSNLHLGLKYNWALPFIVHYYILYVHPYFDFNGRTARMCSLWISMLMDSTDILPTYISEAINDDKNTYYKAIRDTRNSNNDLTYFLTYLIKLANEYYLVYKNLGSIKEELALIGESLSKTEAHYLKRIIVNSKKGWFNHQGFIKFANLDISKQYALRVLNDFVKLNLLKSKTNSKNTKVFALNEDIIKYSIWE